MIWIFSHFARKVFFFSPVNFKFWRCCFTLTQSFTLHVHTDREISDAAIICKTHNISDNIAESLRNGMHITYSARSALFTHINTRIAQGEKNVINFIWMPINRIISSKENKTHQKNLLQFHENDFKIIH